MSFDIHSYINDFWQSKKHLYTDIDAMMRDLGDTLKNQALILTNLDVQRLKNDCQLTDGNGTTQSIKDQHIQTLLSHITVEDWKTHLQSNDGYHRYDLLCGFVDDSTIKAIKERFSEGVLSNGFYLRWLRTLDASQQKLADIVGHFTKNFDRYSEDYARCLNMFVNDIANVIDDKNNNTRKTDFADLKDNCIEQLNLNDTQKAFLYGRWLNSLLNLDPDLAVNNKKQFKRDWLDNELDSFIEQHKANSKLLETVFRKLSLPPNQNRSHHIVHMLLEFCSEHNVIQAVSSLITEELAESLIKHFQHDFNPYEVRDLYQSMINATRPEDLEQNPNFAKLLFGNLIIAISKTKELKTTNDEQRLNQQRLKEQLERCYLKLMDKVYQTSDHQKCFQAFMNVDIPPHAKSAIHANTGLFGDKEDSSNMLSNIRTKHNALKAHDVISQQFKKRYKRLTIGLPITAASLAVAAIASGVVIGAAYPMALIATPALAVFTFPFGATLVAEAIDAFRWYKLFRKESQTSQNTVNYLHEKLSEQLRQAKEQWATALNIHDPGQNQMNQNIAEKQKLLELLNKLDGTQMKEQGENDQSLVNYALYLIKHSIDFPEWEYLKKVQECMEHFYEVECENFKHYSHVIEQKFNITQLPNTESNQPDNDNNKPGLETSAHECHSLQGQSFWIKYKHEYGLAPTAPPFEEFDLNSTL